MWHGGSRTSLQVGVRVSLGPGHGYGCTHGAEGVGVGGSARGGARDGAWERCTCPCERPSGMCLVICGVMGSHVR